MAKAPAVAKVRDLASERGIVETRYRSLLGEAAWRQLPPEVQARFSKHLGPDDVVLYRGRVVATVLSPTGSVLAFAARLIGSPLPTANGASGPALVMVTADAKRAGQRWLRIYERPGQRPQMVQSTKRFRGATGLEEYVGAGLSMELEIRVEDGALLFLSRRYRFEAGPIAFTLPRWLAPGAMTIVHRRQPEGGFTFSLSLDHPVFGRLLYQLAIFTDIAD